MDFGATGLGARLRGAPGARLAGRSFGELKAPSRGWVLRHRMPTAVAPTSITPLVSDLLSVIGSCWRGVVTACVIAAMFVIGRGKASQGTDFNVLLAAVRCGAAVHRRAACRVAACASPRLPGPPALGATGSTLAKVRRGVCGRKGRRSAASVTGALIKIAWSSFALGGGRSGCVHVYSTRTARPKGRVARWPVTNLEAVCAGRCTGCFL